MKYNVKSKCRNIIVWYSKKWYKTTGDTVKDFKIILKDIYYTEDWKEVDIASILINSFSDLIKDNLKEIIGESIYNSRYFFNENNMLDSKLQFILSIVSVIGLMEVEYLEGLDEQYKDLFNLQNQ
jgi:hypothetical protein